MKAIYHTGKSGLEGLQYTTAASAKAPGYGEVRIRLKAAGINHRDLFIMDDRNRQDTPLIPGSDGAGIIEEMGEGVEAFRKGEEVVIHPTLGWNHAADVPVVPGIVGGPEHGTLAEYITLPAENALPKPAALSWEEAGVLSLSTLTAYRALFTRGNLLAGEHVLIPGIGGGVATSALLMAKAAGARVTVTSRSEAKRAEALGLGADQAFDSHEDWQKKNALGPVDLVMDSIGQSFFSRYFEMLRPGGRIVMYGASSGDELKVPIRAIFFPQVSLLGTSIGSREEYIHMLEYISRHRIHPIVDRVYSLENTRSAFERMALGEQFGNIAIRID